MINLPILVIARDKRTFDQFWKGSEFEPTDVKWIRNAEAIHGYIDGLLLVVGYTEGQSEVIDYAKQHNIRVVII